MDKRSGLGTVTLEIINCTLLIILRMLLRTKLVKAHPRKPKDNQSDREKGCDECFQARSEEPWVPTLTRPFPNG